MAENGRKCCESIVGSLKGAFGGQRTTTIEPAYAGNLMAASGGALESKNVKAVAQENEPSPCWINDDDKVRDWVNGYNLSNIAKLCSAGKLTATRTQLSMSSNGQRTSVRVAFAKLL